MVLLFCPLFRWTAHNVIALLLFAYPKWPQTNTKVAIFNAAALAMIQQEFGQRIVVLDANKMSQLRGMHEDNVHMKREYYRQLSIILDNYFSVATGLPQPPPPPPLVTKLLPSARHIRTISATEARTAESSTMHRSDSSLIS